MRIWVNGAGGMVGSHMVEMLHNRGEEVLGSYYRPTVELKEINPAVRMVECDVRYPQSVLKIIEEFRPETIFHLAAQSYPTVSWERPYETMEINAGGTIAVYEAIKHVRRVDSTYDPMVVVACSSAEYGQTLEELEEPFVMETAPLKPLHPYGVSKVAQDLLSYQYFMNDNIRCIRARIFNTTGPRKVGDVTSDFTRRAVEQEKQGAKPPVLTVGNIETRRAILDCRDLIEALLLLSQKGQPGEVYNISSENIYQIREVIDVIEEAMNVHFDVRVDEKLLRPTDEKIIVGNTDKLKRDTGWKQRIPLKETVEDMLEYWRNRP